MGNHTPSKAKRRGRDDYHYGKSLGDCPYSHDYLGGAWREGWEAASAQDHARSAAEQADFQKYRYLPASCRARDKLAEAVGEDQTQLIEDYIKALIDEALNPDNEG